MEVGNTPAWVSANLRLSDECVSLNTVGIMLHTGSRADFLS